MSLKMENKWIAHYAKMARGELPYQKYYIVTDKEQIGEGGIIMVTPTQLAVERAKLNLKCEVAESSINMSKRRILNQSGGRKPTVNTSKQRAKEKPN